MTRAGLIRLACAGGMVAIAGTALISGWLGRPLSVRGIAQAPSASLGLIFLAVATSANGKYSLRRLAAVPVICVGVSQMPRASENASFPAASIGTVMALLFAGMHLALGPRSISRVVAGALGIVALGAIAGYALDVRLLYYADPDASLPAVGMALTTAMALGLAAIGLAHDDPWDPAKVKR